MLFLYVVLVQILSLRIYPSNLISLLFHRASENHPGMAINIQKWSNNNGTVLVFPNNPVKRHPMSRWYDYNVKFTYIGRYGDYMRIRDLPNELRTETVTTYYDSDSEGSSGFACGSPGEVSNSPTEGLVFDIENKEFDSNLGIDRGSNRQNVWFMVSLSAPDQLRQRVAWALSQVSKKRRILFYSLFSVIDNFFLTREKDSCSGHRCDW